MTPGPTPSWSPALGPGPDAGSLGGPSGEASWRWRAAVIGCGRAGALHAERVAASAGGELVAVWDTDSRRGEELARRHGLPAPRALHDLLEPGFLDLVVLATPAHAHRELAERFLRAGIHVLCEQPLAPSSADARAIAAAAEESGRLIRTICRMPYDRELVRLSQRVTSGELGRVDRLDVLAAEPLDPRGDWRGDPVVPGAGVLWDLGPDVLDLVEFLAGQIAALDAYEGERGWGSGVAEEVELRLRGEAGWRGRVLLSWGNGAPRSGSVVLQGSRGTVRLEIPSGRTNGNGSHPGTQAGGPTTAALEAQLRGFCAALLGSRGLPPADRGFRVLQLVEAAQGSLERRVPVPVAPRRPARR